MNHPSDEKALAYCRPDPKHADSKQGFWIAIVIAPLAKDRRRIRVQWFDRIEGTRYRLLKDRDVIWKDCVFRWGSFADLLRDDDDDPTMWILRLDPLALASCAKTNRKRGPDSRSPSDQPPTKKAKRDTPVSAIGTRTDADSSGDRVRRNNGTRRDERGAKVRPGRLQAASENLISRTVRDLKRQSRINISRARDADHGFVEDPYPAHDKRFDADKQLTNAVVCSAIGNAVTDLAVRCDGLRDEDGQELDVRKMVCIAHLDGASAATTVTSHAATRIPAQNIFIPNCTATAIEHIRRPSPHTWLFMPWHRAPPLLDRKYAAKVFGDEGDFLSVMGRTKPPVVGMFADYCANVDTIRTEVKQTFQVINFIDRSIFAVTATWGRTQPGWENGRCVVRLVEEAARSAGYAVSEIMSEDEREAIEFVMPSGRTRFGSKTHPTFIFEVRRTDKFLLWSESVQILR